MRDAELAVAREKTEVVRDGEIWTQLKGLETSFENLASAVRSSEDRLEGVLDPNSSPTGIATLQDIAKSSSPVASRIKELTDRVDGLRVEVEEWRSRIEL